MANGKSTAFNVERVRERMLAGVALPPDMLQKAINKTYEKLEAKKTQFFAFQGEVREEREVIDHATQLAAADSIYKIAGVYARERDSVAQPPTVAMEIDSKTGIVRLVIGSEPVDPGLVELPTLVEAGDASLQLELPPGDELLVGGDKNPFPLPAEAEPEVVKIKNGVLTKSFLDKLFGDA